jgi:hypothetical protein
MSPPVTFPGTLSALFHLWSRKRGAQAMPARRDFSVVELQPWLSDLHLVAVRPEGLRFLVFAPGPAERYGAEMTGRYVSELEPAEMARDVEQVYCAAVETRAPVFSTQNLPGSGGRSWSRLILPLSDDGRTVDRLFVAMWEESDGIGRRSAALQSLLVSRWILAESETALQRSPASSGDAPEIAAS